MTSNGKKNILAKPKLKIKANLFIKTLTKRLLYL